MFYEAISPHWRHKPAGWGYEGVRSLGRQWRALWYLMPYLRRGGRVLIFGDGAGWLGWLLTRLCRWVHVVCIDIPPQLAVQRARIGDRAVYLTPWDYLRMELPYCAAVTVQSFQEMTKTQIAVYMAQLRREAEPGAVFLCINRAQKRIGEELICFEEYGWNRLPVIREQWEPPGFRWWFTKRWPFILKRTDPIRMRLVLMRQRDEKIGIFI